VHRAHRIAPPAPARGAGIHLPDRRFLTLPARLVIASDHAVTRRTPARALTTRGKGGGTG